MKKLFCLLFAIVVISGCRKEEEPQGPVMQFHVIVRDVATGEPIPGFWLSFVQLSYSWGGVSESRNFCNFQTDQNGEYSYFNPYFGSKEENLAIEAERKVGYFLPDTTRYFDIRYGEQNNLTIYMEKASVLNLHLKDVTRDADYYQALVSGRGVTDTAGYFAFVLENKEKGTEKNFRLYVKGNDSILINGYKGISNSERWVHKGHLITVPGKEYNYTIEY